MSYTDLIIEGPTDLRGNVHAPNLINPTGRKVHLCSGGVMRWPMVDGAVLDELPPWLTSSSPVHFGEAPPPPVTIDIYVDTDMRGDVSYWWRWLIARVQIFPSMTEEEYKTAYIEEVGSLALFRDNITSRVCLSLGLEDSAVALMGWISDNIDAIDIEGVVG